MLFALRINILAKGYRLVKLVLCSFVAEKDGKIKEDLAQVLFGKGAESLIEINDKKYIFGLIY